MKNPLHYQLSEYDCGPTSMHNAMSFLFEREEIPPEVIRNIMLYCLDCWDTKGIPGKKGTSCTAMMFLCDWLDGLGRIGQLPVSGQYISGKNVYVGKTGLIHDTLICKGAAVVRLHYEVPHYVLFTGEQGEHIQMFDPYYQEEAFSQPDVQLIVDHPFSYNRLVPFSYFNKETTELYSLGTMEEREAVLLFNEHTKRTMDKTIEYFI